MMPYPDFKVFQKYQHFSFEDLLEKQRVDCRIEFLVEDLQIVFQVVQQWLHVLYKFVDVKQFQKSISSI